MGVGMCGDGDAYPEEFWNCADIEITSGERRKAKVYVPYHGSFLGVQMSSVWNLLLTNIRIDRGAVPRYMRMLWQFPYGHKRCLTVLCRLRVGTMTRDCLFILVCVF